MDKARTKKPPIIPGNWLFGNLMQLKKEGISLYPRLLQEYGDVLEARVGFKCFYLFFNPNHFYEIFVEKTDLYPKGSQYNQLRLLLGNGLLTSEGRDWERQRRLLNPIFGKSGLDLLLGHIKKSSANFVEEIVVGKEIDITKNMFDFTVKIAARSFFGANLENQQLDDMAKDINTCMHFLSKRNTTIANIPLWVPLSSHQKFKKSLKNIKNEVESIYQHKLKNNKENNSKDLLDLLINSKDENQNSFTYPQIFEQVISFLVAGHETTATTLSWLFHLLANHPYYQDKIVEEIQKNNGIFDSSTDLANYPFLEAVLNETMRLYPSVWVLARSSTKDDCIGEWRVKKNKILVVCPYVIHRDARWWNNPDDFFPERFLDKDMIKNLPKGAFTPFGLGKRSCIGARFALLEMTIFCLYFFKKYRISTLQSNIEVRPFITLKTKGPVKITIHKR